MKGIPLQAMADDLALSRALQPFEDTLRSALSLVEDANAEADSEAWGAFLAHYAVLSSIATRIPEVAQELRPVADFMAASRRRRAPSAGTPNAGPTAWSEPQPPIPPFDI